MVQHIDLHVNYITRTTVLDNIDLWTKLLARAVSAYLLKLFIEKLDEFL